MSRDGPVHTQHRQDRDLSRSALSSIYRHDCSSCPLHEHAQTVCVEASGNPAYRMMAIGEAPGRNEDLDGVPFIGQAGAVLDKALRRAFVTDNIRNEIVITNVVKCRPPSNRAPDDYEIETCSNLYLVPEIELIDPICILALGNAACEGLLGVTGVSSIRGQWHRLDRENMTWVMPTFHPAYILYNRGTEIERLFNDDVGDFAAKWIALYERLGE